jgi:hypothetical protein
MSIRAFSKKNDKNFGVSFSSTFFFFSRFRVFLSDGSSKTRQKTFCKKIVSKSFYQKIVNKIQKLILFITFLGVSREGSSKTPYKNIKKVSLTLVLF